MGLDKYTQDMATEFANNEAEHHGFAVGSTKWKSAFKSYCDEATETMTAQNPFNKRNPSVASLKPYFKEIFSESGAAGQIAKHYVGGQMSTSAVEQRILASVTNLVKLFESGRMGNKVKARGGYGKMENSEMSDFQLPKRPEGMSDDDYKKMTKEVLRKWVTRDLLTGFLIESLVPFFALTKNEVEQIVNALVDVAGGSIKAYQEGGADSRRNQLMSQFHNVIGKKLEKVNFYNIVFGKSEI